MRNKKILSIIKFAAMLLLLIPFIVVTITEYGSFHSPWLFIMLMFLMYLDSIIIVWLLFEIKRTFILKKTALGLSMFLLGGWIIALVTTFATKSGSLIPAEHVFGGIYGAFTATAVILGVYAWISNRVYKRKYNDSDANNAETRPLADSETNVIDTVNTATESNQEQKLNAKERRKLKRQKLHNEIIINDEPTDTIQSDNVESIATQDIASTDNSIDNNHENIATSIECVKDTDGDTRENTSDIHADNIIISDTVTIIEDQPEIAQGELTEIEAVVEEPLDKAQYEMTTTDFESFATEQFEVVKDESQTDTSNEIIIQPSIDNTLESEEVAADAIDDGGELSSQLDDLAFDGDDSLSDEFNRVISAFDDLTDEPDSGNDSISAFDDLTDASNSDGYKPIKINVFENDTVIPSDVEVVKNEFVASGKFVDYSIKDETRGMYEEIENENEKKIALMTDLSKVIITSNVNATIVPIEYEILERTFENKLRQSDNDAKEYYSVIKNRFLSYDGVKSRVSKLADTFKCGGDVVCKITVSGKTLLVNLSLDCTKYDAKYYKFVDVGDMSKFADTPMRIKIKNKLTLKRCLEIIDIMFDELHVISSPIESIDYATQYPRVENAVIFMNSIAHLIRRE